VNIQRRQARTNGVVFQGGGSAEQRHHSVSGEFVDSTAVVAHDMGCGDAVPAVTGRRYEDWDLDDPAGKDVAEVRLIRDEIERRVRELLDDLRIPYRS
jgi:protein-tyrosine-phosphatase